MVGAVVILVSTDIIAIWIHGAITRIMGHPTMVMVTEDLVMGGLVSEVTMEVITEAIMVGITVPVMVLITVMVGIMVGTEVTVVNETITVDVIVIMVSVSLNIVNVEDMLLHQLIQQEEQPQAERHQLLLHPEPLVGVLVERFPIELVLRQMHGFHPEQEWMVELESHPEQHPQVIMDA